MRRVARIFTLFGICFISLLAARPALAFPPLPSSFYGTVKVNGANVPDGTLIVASINGRDYAEKQTQTIKGDSMYAMNIPGDDPDTTVVEGGHDGDTIVFTIGETEVDQTGLWKSGTNINIHLAASTTSTLMAPQDTHTPMPTQTAILVVSEATATTKTQVQATPTTGVPTKASSPPTSWIQDTQAVSNGINTENNPANLSLTSVVIGIIVALSILVPGWFFLIRKPKVLK
jgi:hypothetical protein